MREIDLRTYYFLYVECGLNKEEIYYYENKNTTTDY